MGRRKKKSNKSRWRIISLLVLLLILPTVLMLALRLETEEVLIVEKIDLNETNDVVHLDDSLIIPLVYENLDILDSLEGNELKEKFVDILLPSILIAKYRIENSRKKMLQLERKLRWNKKDSLFYGDLAADYKAKSIEELHEKLVTHPNSIVLAQAAIESGWGRSRFSKEANNLFGIWSYNLDEPRIKANYTRGEKAIYLRKYENLSQSIEDYFKVLARSGSYKNFRKARIDNMDPLEMVEHLAHYSELRGSYVRKLKNIIEQNSLTRFDHYKIDPEYIVREKKLR